MELARRRLTLLSPLLSGLAVFKIAAGSLLPAVLTCAVRVLLAGKSKDHPVYIPHSGLALTRHANQVLETVSPANRAGFGRGPLGVRTVLQGIEVLTLSSTDGNPDYISCSSHGASCRWRTMPRAAPWWG